MHPLKRLTTLILALHFQIGTGAGGYKNFRQPDFFDEIQVALYRSKKNGRFVNPSQ